MNAVEQEIWSFLHRHLSSIFNQDLETYKATTSVDLGLYEWYITPHRLDGLDFHLFMNEHHRMKEDEAYRYDLLEPRLQVYGDTVIASYTFMLSKGKDGGTTHTMYNESRVLVKTAEGWRVVHVHKSPAWQAPLRPT